MIFQVTTMKPDINPSHLKPLRVQPSAELYETPPLGMDDAALALDIRRYFGTFLGRDRRCRASHYPYQALALALRDRLMERWKRTRYAYEESDAKQAYYLSLEFLMGRSLNNALLNLSLDETIEPAMRKLGLDLEELIDVEHDAGLGNGGLGRLAACFLDSCATLQLPVTGYGIRYEYGMFRQRIEDCHQAEEPDHWLRDGNPWELERPEHVRRVQYHGRTETYVGADGRRHSHWVDSHDVFAVPYDTPIPGFKNDTVNVLRLWSAAATDEFDLGEFNAGSYPESVAKKNAAENITMVLYPNDASENGKELRLRQQYFLASASLQDVLARWEMLHGRDFSHFAEKNCFQLNDTHPSCAVAELMRLLLDDTGSNGTRPGRSPVRPWPTPTTPAARGAGEMAGTPVRPVAAALAGDHLRDQRPLPQRGGAALAGRQCSSGAHVADRRRPCAAGAHGLSGHRRQLSRSTAWPNCIPTCSSRACSATSTNSGREVQQQDQRRHPAPLAGGGQSRPAPLIGEAIGDGLDHPPGCLEWPGGKAEDSAFLKRWQAVKHDNKVRLAALVKSDCGVEFDPDALFDVQVKRIHEYKRQLLNILHVIHLYARIKAGEDADWTPRCVLIGGKAAPGYFMAKRIITLINNVGETWSTATIQVGNRLKVAFLPNYRVSAMEIIAPGTDLSEQISTAGKEASGTGNMKFMMNGA
jgi:starch phosphorylase